MANEKNVKRTAKTEAPVEKKETLTTDNVVATHGSAAVEELNLSDTHAAIAKRSADGSDGNRFKKTFVVQVESGWNGDDYAHDANKVGVLQEALTRGLHPLSEATFDGQKMQSDGVSLELYYSVEVKPVEDEPTSAETVAPSHSEHLADDK